MADRTVRAIFEARVSGAQKGIRDFSKDVDGAGKKVDGLTKDLKALSASKVTPTVDVKIADAKKRLTDLTLQLSDLKKMDATPEVEADIKQAQAQIREVRAEIKDLNGQRAEVKVDASIKDAKKRLAEITVELGNLRTLEATPEVDADIRAAQRSMRAVRTELRELNAARAEMRVTADTAPARSAIRGLADDVGEAGAEGGEDAGEGIVTGILDALRTIPIAGAIIGVGVAIAGGILLGIKDGLSVEAERDLFSAQTGLDEETSARFGRAAGESYANAWGDSVAANLDTARRALQAGIIDSSATDAEIENVVEKLTGITTLFDYDMPMAVQAVGNALKTGLVKDAEQAFDLITVAQRKLPSDDLLETLNEYSSQFTLVGLSAEQAFGLMVQAAGAGARDTDKVADAVKEFGISMTEGADDARDALEDLGFTADDIFKRVREGGPDGAAAMGEILDALRGLEEQGIDTSAIIEPLFGSPGEDLGASLYALNLGTVSDALGGVEGSAGAAQRALQTMSNNTSTKMEEAKRNVEIAMDGIKGALAEAFGDELTGSAEWVSKNRGPLMQFFLDVINGTLDAAEGFAEMGATGLDAIAGIADGFADLIDALPQWLVGGEDLSTGLRTMGAGAREAAEEIRTNVPDALDEVRDRVNTWAAPELLKARIHDATVVMTGELAGFVEKVGEEELSLTINGDTVDAEAALAVLVDNIDGEDGTVKINGDKVPAEDALDELLEAINRGDADVSVGADTSSAEGALGVVKGKISRAEASMTIRANTSSAEKALKALERTRYATLNVRVAGVTGQGGQTRGAHDGGWTGVLPGRHAGGMVPGRDPGYDNVLWPLNSGGRTLQQPLAGGEYVVNSKDSAYWAPILEWMNNGGRPTTHTETNNAPVYIGSVQGPDLDSVLRKAEQTARDKRAARGRR